MVKTIDNLIMTDKKVPTQRKKKNAPKKVEGRVVPFRGSNKYREEYCDRILDYFTVERTRIVEEIVKGKDGDRVVEVEKPNAPPTLYGFAASIGVCRDTLFEWTKKHEKFAAAVKMAKDMQADYEE
jgi:hypothetical protein